MPAQFPIIFVIAAIVLIAIIALARGGKKDRALFPAHGTVKATGCSVAWSNTELAPMVPMDITGGAA